MADANEHRFQQDIIDELSASGWHVGDPAHYDRQRALYPEDLLAYYLNAHSDQWERFCGHNPHDPETVLLDKTARELDKAGTLEVLRHGFKVPGARVALSSFRPDHGMNANVLAQCRANRLRVMPEVS